MGENLVVKIADFGMGRVVDDLYTARTGTKMPIKVRNLYGLFFFLFFSFSPLGPFIYFNPSYSISLLLIFLSSTLIHSLILSLIYSHILSLSFTLIYSYILSLSLSLSFSLIPPLSLSSLFLSHTKQLFSSLFAVDGTGSAVLRRLLHKERRVVVWYSFVGTCNIWRCTLP